MAGQGEMKKTPIFSGGRPLSLTAFSRASLAATSTGAMTGSRFSFRRWKRMRMSSTTAGQAELMTGFLGLPAMYFRVKSEISSAPWATS